MLGSRTDRSSPESLREWPKHQRREPQTSDKEGETERRDLLRDAKLGFDARVRRCDHRGADNVRQHKASRTHVQVTMALANEMARTIAHACKRGRLMGRCGSSGPSKSTTKRSSSVRVPSTFSLAAAERSAFPASSSTPAPTRVSSELDEPASGSRSRADIGHYALSSDGQPDRRSLSASNSSASAARRQRQREAQRTRAQHSK